MNNFKKFILNGITLTLTSFILRWTNVVFNSYISTHLGAEGMGIYSLVQSVFGFAVTFACSGINLGTTRLVAEALARDRGNEVKESIKKCVFYSLSFSLLALLVLFSGADFLGCYILGDERTVKSIKLLSLSLPFISLSSVFSGYFSAVRRAYKSAISLFLEQFICIVTTTKMLSFFSNKGVEYACLSVAIGTVAAEFISLIYNLILYISDKNKLPNKAKRTNKNLSKKLLKISLPLALSTYVRSGLITLEHLLIPYGLRKNGASYSESLSSYGLIQGMVFPVIMFPSCIIYSFSGLIVPELASYNERKDKKKVANSVNTILRYALIYSIGISGILMCFSYEISIAFYKSSEAHKYIRLFAPLVSIMYLDGAIDGILKGLNEQLYSMKINIADAFLSVTLVYFLTPHFGIKGYVAAVFICEIFNCCMSFTRLAKVCNITFSISDLVVKPILFIILSATFVTLIFSLLGITFFTMIFNLSIRIITVSAIYIMLTVLFRPKKISVTEQ